MKKKITKINPDAIVKVTKDEPIPEIINKAAAPKTIDFPSKQFAFKVTSKESEDFHAVAGPGKASKVARGLIQLFGQGRITHKIIDGNVTFNVR